MKKIKGVIKKSKNIAIIAHISPDQDCLSSMVGLKEILLQLNKNVKMFVDCDKLSSKFVFYNLPDDYNSEINIDDYDAIFAVDIADLTLMGKYGPDVIKHNNFVIIDHHSNRRFNSKIQYIDTSKASCSEIIFDLAKYLKVKITKRFAELIYAGILGDTNCFQNDNVTVDTFLTASECLRYGADKDALTFIFEKQQSLQEIKMKKLHYDNMKIENEIAYLLITTKMEKEFGVEDCSSYVNELLNIDNNKFAFIVRQKEKNLYSLSMRCKKGYDVSVIATKYGGGGHKQASGARFVGSPVKHINEIYNECLKQIKGKDNV